MKTFTDKTGKEWKLEMTVGVADQIRAKFGIDVLHPEKMDDKGRTVFFADLIDEPTNLFEVIGHMVDGQAPEGMTDAEFRSGLSADVIRDATVAFYEELEYFFVVLGRPDRAQIMKTVRQNLTKAYQLAETEIRTAASKIDLKKEFQREMQKQRQTAGK